MRINIIILAVVFLLANAMTGSAQNDNQTTSEKRNTVALNTGFSLVGSLLAGNNSDSDYETFAIPAIQLTYDYNVIDWLSLGLAGSFQMMGMEYANYGSNNESFKTTITRTNFAVRGLFHYGNSDVLDMYSGVRFGMTHWGASTEYDGEDYDVEEDATFTKGFGAAPQLVLFGIRGYFTDNFGVNMEFAVGSPHYLSLGLNYRF